MNRPQPAEGTFAAQKYAPVNPCSHEGAHEGPRGYAHSLKDGATFVVLDEHGDINRGGWGHQGLYHGDTRYVSRLALSIEGAPPVLLYAATRHDNSAYVSHLLSPEFSAGGQTIDAGAIHLERTVTVSAARYYEQLHLTSYALEPVLVRVGYEIGADFRDMFEIRGIERAARGDASAAEWNGGDVSWSYVGRDETRRETRVCFDPAPDSCGGNRAEFLLRLEPRQLATLNLVADCGDASAGAMEASHCTAAAGQVATERRRAAAARCDVRTSNELYNRWLERSAADLDMLTTPVATGRYPFAGLPWFNAIFGRDGIITALETLWVDAGLARGVLTTLAEHQATTVDEASDAEPGKIVHEMHDGEMAQLGEVPFHRYYGTSDATPLYVILAGRYLEATGDVELIRNLWPHIDAALRWISDFGDCDGDGFIEYRSSPHGLLHQGWRDSPDAVFHADGTPVEGPVALCEVQAWSYKALCHGASIARLLGDMKRSSELNTCAARLRKQFHEAFWSAEIGTYAMALDGGKRKCLVSTSNAGHTLGGIAQTAYAARVASELVSPAMFNGWGVRTVSANAARYNPASYHNGSIWPHDNAMLADAFRRCRMNQYAALLLQTFAEASARLEMHRLPELICGFPRDPDLGPTPYPSACAPQAGSAGAVFLMLASAFGLRLDAFGRKVIFEQPVLPDGLDEIEIHDLVVGEGTIDLAIYRRAGKVAVAVARNEGRLQVQIVP